MEIYPKVVDAGDLGAELHVFLRPNGCPGLGGWKRTKGGWMTRVKGQEATEIISVAKCAPDHVVTLEMNEDEIVNISI